MADSWPLSVPTLFAVSASGLGKDIGSDALKLNVGVPQHVEVRLKSGSTKEQMAGAIPRALSYGEPTIPAPNYAGPELRVALITSFYSHLPSAVLPYRANLRN